MQLDVEISIVVRILADVSQFVSAIDDLVHPLDPLVGILFRLRQARGFDGDRPLTRGPRFLFVDR